MPGSGKNVFEEYPKTSQIHDEHMEDELRDEYSTEFESDVEMQPDRTRDRSRDRSNTRLGEKAAITYYPHHANQRISIHDHIRAEKFSDDLLQTLEGHDGADGNDLRAKIQSVWHAHMATHGHHHESIYVPHGEFLKAHIKDQMRDDLALGIYRKKQVVPACKIPSTNSEDLDVDVDEKIDTVLSDPKFGMFSLFMWHWNEGYKNRELKEKNVVYCSHIFSLWSGLPLLVFLSQWTMYIALVMYIYEFSRDHKLCPQNGTVSDKVLMAGVALLYFVKSFFLWDALVDRSRRRKVNPSNSVVVLLDGLQEIGFNLLCYFGNLWIVFHEENIINAILDSLAMEFLMVLDNQFEELYFSYLPGNAVKIYDDLFVTYAENEALVEAKKQVSCCFLLSAYILQVPYKLLQFCLILFPFGCIAMIVYGIGCK